MISRVSQSIQEKGVEGARLETDILKVFASDAERRIRAQIEAMDNNDDELVKGLAAHAFENEAYGWDNI